MFRYDTLNILGKIIYHSGTHRMTDTGYDPHAPHGSAAPNVNTRSNTAFSSIDNPANQRPEAIGDAIASGDVDEQVTINKDLARLAVEAERLNKAKIDREELEKKVSEQTTTSTPPDQSQAPKEVHPKAKAWAEKNSWFGSDEPMTLTAFSINKQLVEGEGYDPTSDSYYAQIDGRIREAFPHKFKETVKSTPSASPVASVSRASRAKSGKKVTLSKSEVAIAKKLGISLEQYAKQKQYLATR